MFGVRSFSLALIVCVLLRSLSNARFQFLLFLRPETYSKYVNTDFQLSKFEFIDCWTVIRSTSVYCILNLTTRGAIKGIRCLLLQSVFSFKSTTVMVNQPFKENLA